MSTNNTKLPLSAVIFDRTQLGKSDVPVFSDILKRKINTAPEVVHTETLSSGAVRALSAVRADPVRGQATGFAQTAEGNIARTQEEVRQILSHTPSVVSITEAKAQAQAQEEPKPTLRPAFAKATAGEQGSSTPLAPIPYTLNPSFSFLREDPSLYRHSYSTDHLREFLATAKTIDLTKPVAPAITIPLMPPMVESTHTSGLIDAVYLPAYKPGKLDPIEEYIYALRRNLLSLRLTLSDLLAQTPGKAQTGKEKLIGVLEQLITELTKAITKIEESVKVRVSSGKEWAKTIQKREKKVQPVVETETESTPVIEVAQSPITISVAPQLEQIKTLLSSLSSVVVDVRKLQGVASRVLLAGSIVVMLLTVGPMVILEAQSWKQKLVYSLTPKAGESTPSPMAVNNPTPSPSPSAIPTPDRQFQLQIPKIGADMKVIANVDAGNEKEYNEALKRGVAHAAGTNLPGVEDSHTKTIFIFGHSTNGEWNISRYNALFYNLKDLVIGDDIKLWFWGDEYNYKVTQRKIVEANDTSFLESQTDSDQLILQTCWPPGTTWKRLLIFAEKK